MRYGSICSGVAPQTDDWAAMGLECAWFSEIEPFPSAVLAYRHPDIPNLGDFTWIGSEHGAIELLVGGTPCQSFSVAGKRAGLDDPRGNLTIEFARLAQRLRPRWLAWENVPGVLSIDEGRTFGAFLGMLGELGYGTAYRVLDAQHFGVAQRRRRVFVVGCLGDWRGAAAVLFERQSLCGYPPPRRTTGQGVTRGMEIGPSGGSFTDLSPTLDSRAKDGFIRNQLGVGAFVPEVCGTLSDGAHMGGGLNGQDAYSGRIIPVAHALRADDFDASEDGTGRGTPLIAFRQNNDSATQDEVAATITSRGPSGTKGGLGADTLLAFDTTQVTSAANYSNPQSGDPCHPLASTAHPPAIAIRTANTGANGHGVAEEVSHTLDGAQGQAVAMVIKGAAIGREPENGPQYGEILTDGSCYTLNCTEHHAVAFDAYNQSVTGDVSQTLQRGNGNPIGGAMPTVLSHMAVRRLTPRECEKLQGFSDDYTLVPWRGGMASDGPRYKAIGNSWAVPVLHWIAKRIIEVDEL